MVQSVAILGCAAGAVFACSQDATPRRGESSNAGAGASGNGTVGIVMTTGSGGPRCDEAGNCACINIGMLGRFPNYGAVPGSDDTEALNGWLNTNSSATVDAFVTKPALTEEFLANYDVLILQALENAEGAGNQWQFSADEKSTFEAWVRQGGGVIALQGYGGDPAEATPTNELLAFTGLQYTGLTGPGDTALPGSCPNECCYCLGNSIPTTGFDPAHPISANITAVGSYYGRSISAPADAQIVASSGNIVYGATVQVDNGRVFMFHDEWVTYSSQWNGTGLQTDCRTLDMNHSCYNVHPSNNYQVPQFWYNSLRWASGNVTCFDIRSDEIVK